MAIFAKTKAAAEFRVRSLEDVSGEYAELRAKRQAFIDKKSHLERERVVHSTTDYQSFHALKRLERVGSLVAGEVELADLPVSPESAWRAKFAEIDRQIADAKSAIELCDTKLSGARHKASAIVVEEVRGEYTARVVQLCQAIVAAYGASKNLEDLKSEFNAQDLAWAGPLKPIGAAALHGGYATFLQAAVRDGFISATEVPGVLSK
jgi:hypothetical protein